MSDNRSRGSRDFSKYDSMKSEDLEEILRLDADAPEGTEADTELLLYVMGVLADRRRNSCHTGNTAQEAYESFMQNYLSDEDDIEVAPETENKPVVRSVRWLRRITAAAAVLAVVFLSTLAVDAFGIDIWGTFAKWTKETFHFASGEQTEIDEPNPDNELPYASLQEALAHHDENYQMVPAWVPSGYTLDEIFIEDTPLQKTYIAYYENGEKALKISVRSDSSSFPEYIEKSDDFVAIYKIHGMEFYLFSNLIQTRAVWTDGSYECYISGDLTIEELKMMIDSIRKDSRLCTVVEEQ